MSLFTVLKRVGCIDQETEPKTTRIDGEFNGSYYSGRIEMTYLNETENLEDYKIYIGKILGGSICLHDFKIMIDNNPFKITIMEKEEARAIFENKIEQNENAVYGESSDSYSSLEIPNILPNQKLTISAEFELPVTFPTNDTIGIIFPLTCPSNNNSIKLKCSDFRLTCKFSELNENSVTSNPEGKLDLPSKTYAIDHIDENFTNVSIIYDPNVQSKTFSLDNGLGVCSGNFGSFTFVPKKDSEKRVDHSGEEFTFIIDCSGSMCGNEIKLAAQCLIFFIKSLPKDCFFNVVCFGSEFSSLFDKPVPYTNENAKKAICLAFSLEADMGGTVLSSPLSYVFQQPPSKPNKLRRIFVLTDGCVFDPDFVIDLVKRNSATTMSSAIGIGYGVDRNLVEGIGEAGNGLVDFVLSGDDMRSKVINQLEQSINGLCHVEVAVENNESVEIVPPINNVRLALDKPFTFYVKSTKELTNNDHVRVDVEGNSEPIIIQLNSFPQNSRTNKNLRYLFNNENIKFLLRKDQTSDVMAKVTNLSIENGILCHYTSLLGTLQYESEEEENRIKNFIKKLKDEREIIIRKERKEEERKEEERRLCEIYNVNNMEEYEALKKNYVPPNQININGYRLDGNININPNNTRIEDIKSQIAQQFEIPVDLQNLCFADIIMKDGKCLKDYLIPNDAHINVEFDITDDRVFKSLKQQYVIPDHIFVKKPSGQTISLHIDPNYIRIKDIKNRIQEKVGTSIVNQRLIYKGKQLENNYTLRDLCIPQNSTFFLINRLRGGGPLPAARTFIDGNNSDLIQIVAQQNIEGNWDELPKEMLNEENNEINKLNQKIVDWCKGNKFGDSINAIVATIFCLTFMIKFKKEAFSIWKIIYAKGIEWLKSINENINWNKLIKSF